MVSIGIVSKTGVENPYLVEVIASMFQCLLGNFLGTNFKISCPFYVIQSMPFNGIHKGFVSCYITVICFHGNIIVF